MSLAPHEKLWQLLLERKVIKPRHFRKAVAACQKTGVTLDTELVANYGISRPDILMYLRAVSPVDVIDLESTAAQPQIAQLIAEDISRRYGLLCVEMVGQRLVVAMLDPDDSFALEYVRVRSGKEIDPRATLPGDLERATEKAYAQRVEISKPSKPQVRPELEFKPLGGGAFEIEPARRVTKITLDEAPALGNAPVTTSAASTTQLRVAKDLMETTARPKLIQKLVFHARSLVPAEAAGILFPSGEFFFKRSQAENIQQIPLEDSILHFSLQQKLPQKLNELDEPMTLAGSFIVRQLICAPAVWQEKVHGVVVMMNRKVGLFRDDDLSLLETLAFHTAVALQLGGEASAPDPGEGSIELLCDLLDASGAVDRQHGAAVARVAAQMGRYLDLPVSDLRKLRAAAMLHDLGKLKCFGARAQMHPEGGAQMLKKAPAYAELAAIVGSHHEYADGSGYPAGLAGGEIPLLGRILALAECWEEEGNNAPEEFWAQFGSRFDPALKDAFFASVRG